MSTKVARSIGACTIVLAAALLVTAAFESRLIDSPTAREPRGSSNVQKDIDYVPNAAPRQKLDLYVPAQSGFGTVVYFHEGSLRGGDKSDPWYDPIAKHFQAKGYGFALINYRLLQDAKWPAQPQDCAAAVAWVKKNIKARGGDPTKIFLVGHSSGARLSALLATDGAYLNSYGLGLKDVLGAVVMGTMMWNESLEKYTDEQIRGFMQRDRFRQIYGEEDALNTSWPMAHVSKDQRPILCLIAEEEQIHPPILAQSQAFQKASRALGATVEYQVMPGRNHMQNMKRLSEEGDQAFVAILKFFRSCEGS